jgi:hypothetical protein
MDHIEDDMSNNSSIVVYLLPREQVYSAVA